MVVTICRVVCSCSRTVSKQSYRSSLSTSSRDYAQKGLVKLVPRLTVKSLDRVILQYLLDQFDNRELGQIVQLPRIGNRVSKLSNRQSTLDDSEVGLRHGIGFNQHPASCSYVREDIPCKNVP